MAKNGFLCQKHFRVVDVVLNKQPSLLRGSVPVEVSSENVCGTLAGGLFDGSEEEVCKKREKQSVERNELKLLKKDVRSEKNRIAYVERKEKNLIDCGNSEEMRKIEQERRKAKKTVDKSDKKVIEVKQFGVDYCARIYVDWLACECCQELCRRPNLKYVKSDFHNPDDFVLLCYKCQREDKYSKGGFCKYNLILNKLDPGIIPDELKLGYMELQSVRLIQPFISVVHLPKTITKGTGQMVHISSFVVKSVASLGRFSENDSVLLAVSQKKKEGDTRGGTRYSTCQVAVYEALRKLKNDNFLYADVQLRNLEAELRLSQLPRELKQIDVFDSHALIDMAFPIPLDYSKGIGRELPHNSSAVWDMNGKDISVEEKSYPNLFPYGYGGEYSARDLPLKTVEYHKLRLLNSDNRFQKDLSYVFRSLNLVQKQYLNSQINYVLRDGEKHVGKLSAEKLSVKVYPQIGKRLRGSEAYFSQLRRDLGNMMNSHGPPQFFISINLRYCPELLCHVQPDIYGSMNNPNWTAIDNISEVDFVKILCEHCGLAAKMFQSRAEAFDTFLRSSTSGAFPDGIIATDVFIKVEFQRSGNPHLHCLVWLNKTFDVETSDGRADVLEFLDKFLTTELPDEKINRELNELVKRHQLHRHTFTCRKGNNNRFKFKKRVKNMLANESDVLAKAEDELVDDVDDDECEENFEEQLKNVKNDQELKKHDEEFERFFCRFGLPHRLSENSRFLTSKEHSKRVRGDRDYTLKRLTEISRRIVGYNREWLKLFKCNIDFQFVTDFYAALVYFFSYVSKPESKDRDILSEVAKKCGDVKNLKSLLFRFGNAVLSHRQVGKVEAAMILLGCLLYYCSTSSVFLFTCLPCDRNRLIKNGRLKENRPLIEDDFVVTMDEHYKNRNKCMGMEKSCMDRLLDMTMVEFFSWFVTEVRNGRELGENVDEEDVIDLLEEKDESDGNVQLNNGWHENETEGPFMSVKRRQLPRLIYPNGYVLRMRKKQKNVAFKFDGKDMAKKGFGLLMVTVPFVGNEEELLRKQDILGDVKILGEEPILFSEENITQRIREKKKQIQERIMTMTLTHRLYMKKNLSMFFDGGVQNENRKRKTSLCDDVLDESDVKENETSALTEEEDLFFGRDLTVKTEGLSVEQLYVYRKFEKYLNDLLRYHEAKFSGQNNAELKEPVPLRMFIQGAAGTGKTYLIECLQKLVYRHVIAENVICRVARPSGGCLVCAPTGAAAFNIKGSTVHDMFGLTIDQGSHGTRIINSDQKLQNLRTKLGNAILIVIDEVSMLSPSVFGLVNSRLNDVCDVSSENNTFFGNKCVLLLGDLFQLRPVANKYIFQESNNLVSLWNLFLPVVFKTNLRQASDPFFARLLDSLRNGNLNDEVDGILRSRCIRSSINKKTYREMQKLYDKEYKYLPHLFSTRREAKEHNFRIMNELSRRTKNPILEFKAEDSKNESCRVRKRMKVLSDEVKPKKKKNDEDEKAGLSDRVYAVEGCRVMLTHNLDTKTGLVNGALGTVVNILWWNSSTGVTDDLVQLARKINGK